MKYYISLYKEMYTDIGCVNRVYIICVILAVSYSRVLLCNVITFTVSNLTEICDYDRFF